MPVIKVGAGKSATIPTAARYLSIINANGQFNIEAPQLGRVIGKLGRQYDLQNYSEVEFNNPNNGELSIEYEVANILISQSGSGSVSVDNKITVETIENLPQFNVNATIDRVGISQPTVMLHNNVLSIPAQGSLMIAQARDAGSRRVTVQIQTPAPGITKLNIGGNDTVSANSGLLLQGNIDTLPVAVFNSAAEIWAFNNSEALAVVGVLEEFRP